MKLCLTTVKGIKSKCDSPVSKTNVLLKLPGALVSYRAIFYIMKNVCNVIMKYLVLLYLRVPLTKKNDCQSQRESYRQYSNTTGTVEEKMVFMPEPIPFKQYFLQKKCWSNIIQHGLQTSPTFIILDQHVGLVSGNLKHLFTASRWLQSNFYEIVPAVNQLYSGWAFSGLLKDGRVQKRHPP